MLPVTSMRNGEHDQRERDAWRVRLRALAHDRPSTRWDGTQQHQRVGEQSGAERLALELLEAWHERGDGELGDGEREDERGQPDQARVASGPRAQAAAG